MNAASTTATEMTATEYHVRRDEVRAEIQSQIDSWQETADDCRATAARIHAEAAAGTWDSAGSGCPRVAIGELHEEAACAEAYVAHLRESMPPMDSFYGV